MSSTLQIARLTLGAPAVVVTEPLGDPVATLGGAVVAGSRTAPQYQVGLSTSKAGQLNTPASGELIRRAVRGLLNNTPLKAGGFLYLIYSDDVEFNGWYVPDQTTLSGVDAMSWIAAGTWQTPAMNWYLAGHQRTHREARQVWMKDLRTGLYPRDYLGWLLSTDFSFLPSLQLSVLPNGASSSAQTVSGQVVTTVVLPTGRDTGVSQQASGLSDLTVVSYERAETALNLSDVIVYDRRGQITAPTTGPDTLWEEVYGPDYPWNWQISGQPVDCPVLDNGLVRVRYDSTNTDGFSVDVWTGAAYVEQGKMVVERIGDSSNFDGTFVAASLMEYTPERAVIQVVLANGTDALSRERVLVTMQRGELGVTFETYPGLRAAGTQADAVLEWTPALNSGVADLNNGVCKLDSQGTLVSGVWTPVVASASGVYAATAGTGAGTGNSGLFGSLTSLGNANFTVSENWVALLRCPTVYSTIGAYQTTLTVLQAANTKFEYAGTRSDAYGTTSDCYQVLSQNAAGYVQCQVQFAATQAQQILEAESITLGSGTTSTVDAAASGGHAATATRTSDANAHVTQATWPNSFSGTYRVFIRVKVSANSASFYATTGATTGLTRSGIANTSYAWLDLGEIVANATTLSIHAWMSGGAGTVSVDRVEAVLVQDRARTGAIYSGSRDAGQAALEDSRMLGSLVAR